MKSLNVRKIAAVAAGAALIGTALAGAAVTVDENLGNYVFLQNGEPQVKLVVGSASLPSDAIWAGNIAAALANKAFTTEEAAAPAAGSSTTVAPVTVSVQTAANAVPAGTYGFTSFFGDDDVDNAAENTYNRSAAAPGYNGNMAPTKEISSTTTSLLKDGTVDTKGKYTSAITVREYVNLAGSADYSSSSDKYVLRTPRAWYALTYSPGLPVCLDTTNSLELCATNNRLDRAGIHLNFLGTDYLVSALTVSGTPTVLNSLTLSKASVDQVVAAGTTITSPEGYSVEVQSISAPQTSATVSSVALLVRSPSNATESLTITSGAAPTKVLGSVYVQVPDSFYVATGTSTARVIFSTGSVRMVQNTTVDESVFGKWQASFTTNNVSTSQAISRLQLGNDFQPGTLNPGEGLDIITGAPGFRWTFQGSNLVTADYTTLAVDPVSLDSIQVNGNVTSCSFAAVRFTSSRNDAFKFGNEQKSQVWWLAKNKTSAGCNVWNGVWLYQNTSSVYAASLGGGVGQNIGYTQALANATTGDTGFISNLTFNYPGSGTDASVTIVVNSTSGRWQNFSHAGIQGTGGTPVNSSSLYEVPAANSTGGNATYVNVTIPEILNESTTTAGGQWNIAMTFGSGSAAGSATATDLGVRDAIGLTTAGKVNYSTIPAASTGSTSIAADQAGSYFGDVPLYSPRGSYVSSAPTSTGYTISYSSKLGRAQFVLSTQGTNLTAGTSTISCTPGAQCDLGGGSKITIPVGAGAAAGTNQVRVPLNLVSNSLVVLDSDASSTQPLIVVGGPFVNSVAASMEAASLFDACDPSVGGDAVVQVEGNKVLVAGCSADDTMEAAKELISFLASSE